jgi:hypothetical protein
MSYFTGIRRNNRSVAPDGPSMQPPKNETCIAGKKEGQAVRRSLLVARLGMRLISTGTTLIDQ